MPNEILANEDAVEIRVFKDFIDQSDWQTGTLVAGLANHAWQRAAARARSDEDVDLFHKTGIAAVCRFHGQTQAAKEGVGIGLENADYGHRPHENQVALRKLRRGSGLSMSRMVKK